MGAWIRLACWIVSLILCAPVWAQDLVVSRAMLEDPTGRFSISDVVGMPFAPAGKVLSEGYSDSVYWLRVEIRAPDKGREVVVRIRPSILDEVRLYEARPGDPARWPTRVTGDRYPFEERDLAAVSLGFLVHVDAPVQTYYLRLKTRTSVLMTADALTPRLAQIDSLHQDLALALYLTLMLTILGWAAQDYALHRRPEVVWFGVHQATYLVYGVIGMGYLLPLASGVPAQVLDQVSSIVVLAHTWTFMRFSQELLKAYTPTRWFSQGLAWLLWVPPVLLVFKLAGDTQAALHVNALLVVFSRWYLFAMSCFLRHEQVPSRRVLRVIFFIFALGGSVLQAALMGWLPVRNTNMGTSAVLILQGAVASLLIALVLYRRGRELSRQLHQNALDLMVVMRTVDAERRLKAAATALAQTDYLTGMDNRRSFIGQSEQVLSRSVGQGHAVSLLMIDIDHFKSINDRWGHDGGDVVLCAVAQLMRGALREVDVFGRMGGEEFAATLVDIEPQEALAIAERLRTAVAQCPVALPGGEEIRVTVSIGMTSMFDGQGKTLDELLKQADLALYAAKRAGRNAVRVFDPSMTSR